MKLTDKFDGATVECLCVVLSDETLMRVHSELREYANETDITVFSDDTRELAAMVWGYLAERVNGAAPEGVVVTVTGT